MLNPGTYRFKILDSAGSRHIVQIFNEDGTKLIQTVLAVPNFNLQPSGKTALLYANHPARQPQALEAWFYPGDNFGYLFVYPKAEATELGQLNDAIVPSLELGDEDRISASASNLAPAKFPAANSAETVLSG